MDQEALAKILASHGGKAIEILLAMAESACAGEGITIAEDWGFGTATVIAKNGAHTHVGVDWDADRAQSLASFVDGLHNLLVGHRGLSWVKPVTS